MAASPVFPSVTAEARERFSASKWPKVLGEWSAATEGNENWRTELAPEWEATINGLDDFPGESVASMVEQRGILKTMGLVETPKMKFRTWVGFSLFAPQGANWDLFASRVKFTEAGLDLIESAGVPETPSRSLSLS